MHTRVLSLRVYMSSSGVAGVQEGARGTRVKKTREVSPLRQGLGRHGQAVARSGRFLPLARRRSLCPQQGDGWVPGLDKVFTGLATL